MNIFQLYKRLPPRMRNHLKMALGAKGHKQSLFNLLKGYRQASGSKSLTNSLADLVESMRVSSVDTIGQKVCMDFGAGYVLSDSVALYLLGAKAVYAIDNEPLYQPRALRYALKGVDWDAVINLCRPFADESAVRKRCQYLWAINYPDLPALQSLGITYVAPLNYSFAHDDIAVDLICSTSVFEHIPRSIVMLILTNLAKSMNDGGVMVNKIHLEDHLDLDSDPFGFYYSDTGYSYCQDYDSRGNRILLHEWVDIFSGVPGILTRIAKKTEKRHLMDASRELDPNLASKSPNELYFADVHFVSQKASID